MKRQTMIAAAAAALGLAALLAWAFAPRPPEVETASVTRGHFEASIDEDAKTRLRDRYVVSAPLAGVLSRITLREGDAVAADTVVATLRPVLPALQDARTLRELQARVDAAADLVQSAGARMEGARVALLQARNELQRNEQLARQGFVAATKLEADRLAERGAQVALEAAASDRRVAGHELEQAQAALGALRGAAAPGAGGGTPFALKAPVAGRVLRIAQASEGAVALGTPLIEIGDTAALEVVAELLTTDALQARPGSRVLIERWGGPGTLEGRVRGVEPAAFTKVSALGVEEQRVRVLIDLASPASQWQALGDGFRVSVRIVTLAQEAAHKVPVGALFPLPAAQGSASGAGGAGGGMAVYRLEDGRARLQPVQVGARNGSEAWLLQGPAPGTSVIVYPPQALRDGMRVKVRSV